MWRNSNLTAFELRTFSTDSNFKECFKGLVVECEFVEKFLFYDWFHMVWYALRAREPRQTCFFLKFRLSHKLQLLNVQHNFFLSDALAYTVLIETLILLTSGNSILLQLFNWPKPVHVLTNKIIASSCIRIRWILIVEIHIRRTRILTSFVASLIFIGQHTLEHLSIQSG